MTKNVFVGIDPGNTVGVAILDLEGNIINLSSKREAGRSEIIRHILKFGRPLVIASDVNPSPKNIVKLASAMGARTFFPSTRMSNFEKNKIVRDFVDVTEDAHQKDALAAALKAHKSYRELISKVKIAIRDSEEKSSFEKVMKLVLFHETENIYDALKKASGKDK